MRPFEIILSFRIRHVPDLIVLFLWRQIPLPRYRLPQYTLTSRPPRIKTAVRGRYMLRVGVPDRPSHELIWTLGQDYHFEVDDWTDFSAMDDPPHAEILQPGFFY